MALEKVRTNSGHAAGKSGGRWCLRVIAKHASRKRRRREDREKCNDR